MNPKGQFCRQQLSNQLVDLTHLTFISSLIHSGLQIIHATIVAIVIVAIGGHCKPPEDQSRAKLQKRPASNETCGGVEGIAKRVEACAQPLMDILEGSLKKWPTTNQDVKELCDSVSSFKIGIRYGLFKIQY